MTVRIRQARLADLDALTALWAELAEFHIKLDRRYALADGYERHTRQFLADCLQDPGWQVLLAEENGVTIGFISGLIRESSPIVPYRRYGYIEDAGVTATCRRQGVGERLCRALEAWFAQHQVTVIELNAAFANPVSQRFWHKMGYADLSIRMRKDTK